MLRAISIGALVTKPPSLVTRGLRSPAALAQAGGVNAHPDSTLPARPEAPVRGFQPIHPMHTTSPLAPRRSGLSLLAKTWALPAILALAALASPTTSLAGVFQTTTISPATQTVEAGTPFSVNVVAAVGSTTAYGIQAWVNFDPTKLQVVSVSTGASSPWTNVFASSYDNTAGKLTYGATGGATGGTFTAATIVFNPIAAGATTISFQNVNEYMSGYGPYGVNGLASGAAVTINATLPTQTLTILGGSGSPGAIAANVEYYNPATGNWQPAYLTGWHPWGFATGTNSWINYTTNTASDPGAGPTTNQTLWYLYRVRFTVPSDAVDPQMTFSVKADNFAQIAINGVTAGGSQQFINNTTMNNVIVGAADQVNVDAVFSQNVHPGENTITLNIGDWGGLNGFNFRIDLSMKSSEPLEIVPPEPADSTPPVIAAPADIATEATGPAGAVVSFAATANDDVDGPVSVLADPASGSTFPLGTTVVDLGAADSAGNIATASFNVTVKDTTPPVITAPADVTAEATSAAGATVTYALPGAEDIVSGNVAVAASQASGSTFSLGATSVGLTATDAAGNTATASFTVTVVDTTAPELSVPDNVTAEATSASGAIVTYPAATATDAVGVTSLNHSQASGSTFALGTTTVNVNASDAAGNTSTGSFSVTVVDTTAPVISSLTPSSATLWSPNHKMVPITLSASTADAVGVTSLKIVSVTSNEPDNGLGDGDTAGDTQITGDLTVNLRAERGGKGNGRIYTITVEAADAAGNTSTLTCTVSVPKSQGKK